MHSCSRLEQEFVSRRYTPLDNGPLGGLSRPKRTSLSQIVHVQGKGQEGQGQGYSSTTRTWTKGLSTQSDQGGRRMPHSQVERFP
jgi:hypothetical protein